MAPLSRPQSKKWQQVGRARSGPPVLLAHVVIMRKKVASVSQRTLARFAGRASRAAHLRGRVDVLITSSTQMRDLNLRFRGNRKPTDVLSFPSHGGKTHTTAGDIAVSAHTPGAHPHRLGPSV